MEREDFELLKKCFIKIKNALFMDFHLTNKFSLYKSLMVSHVDYCDVFIRCFYSHSDGTHSLNSMVKWLASEVIPPYLFQ